MILDPKGPYPICKPRLGDTTHCERCGREISRQREGGPCPAIPPEKRWRMAREGEQ